MISRIQCFADAVSKPRYEGDVKCQLKRAGPGAQREGRGAGAAPGHENKVDLGILRGADHDGRVLVLAFAIR